MLLRFATRTVIPLHPVPMAADGTSISVDHVVQRMPVLMLHVHSDCNCRCVMCDIWKSRAHREVSLERVKGWLPEWQALGVARIVLTGGEPLMHSRIADLLGMLKGGGLSVTVLSTGLLAKRHAEALSRDCDELILSLDGPEAVHNAIRGVPRAFDRLAEGVRALRSQGGVRPQITARCTVQRANCASLCATVETAIALGLEGISFLAVDVGSEAFDRAGPLSDERVRALLPSNEQLRSLEAEINALEVVHRDAFASGYIAEKPDKLRRRLLHYFQATLGRNAFATINCNAPWVSAVLETDGTMRPCFFHPAYNRVDGGPEATLASMLNAPGAVSWRAMLDVKSDPTCRRCVCSLMWKDPPASRETRGSG